MYKNKRILGIIPARKGSKGLPGKNIIPLLNKPLIAWSIEQARGSSYLDKVIVSTDGEEIAKVAKRYMAEVPFKRPASLSTDAAKSADLVTHALSFFENCNDFYDYICLIEPTSPLREPKDIDTSIRRIVNNQHADSLVSICPLESRHPEFNIILSPDNYIKRRRENRNIKSIRRQELSPVYFLDGTIYIVKTDFFRKRKTFYGDKTLGYIVPRYKGLEIDDYYDIIAAGALLRYVKNKRRDK